MPETKPSKKSIRHFLDYTWKDIHHSRLQNWTGITVVTAFHIGIFQIIDYFLDKGNMNYPILIVVLIFGALFCFIGFLITQKHQSQLYEKLGEISRAEKAILTDRFKKKKQDRTEFDKFIERNFWTVGSLMGYFFILLMIFDIIAIFYSAIKMYLYILT